MAKRRIQRNKPRVKERPRGIRSSRREAQPTSEQDASRQDGAGKGRLVFAYAILVAAFVAGMSLRVTAIGNKNWVTHDEAVSFLAATGHEAEFLKTIDEEVRPYGVWCEARDWKRFTRVEDVLCLSKIRDDLAETDIHPPMYFWLLHLWCLVFGVHIWTGGTLNLVVTAVSMLALFALARYVLCDAVRAAFVAFIWAVSPSVLPISLVARHYDLLALTTILFVRQVVRCTNSVEPLGRGSLIKLALLSAFGLLTHYHFTLLIMGSGLFTLVKTVKRRRRFYKMSAAVVVGALIFVALHPGFYHSIQTGLQGVQDFGSEPVTSRVERTINRYAAFFVNSGSLPVSDRRSVEYTVLVGLVGMSLLVAGREGLRRLTSRPGSGSSPVRGLYVLYFFFWTAATNILLYLTFISPKHAMEPKYSTMVWPFFAFVPVLLMGTFRKTGSALTMALCCGMLGAATLEVSGIRKYSTRLPDPSPLFRYARQVVIDNVDRGRLPRALWSCPDEMRVLAASPGYLLARKTAWLHDLPQDSLYLSIPGRGDGREKRQAFIQSIHDACEVTRIQGGFWNLGEAYWIRGARQGPIDHPVGSE